ncbi:MAG TPA: hypothetical protein VE961_07350, partial [Pyrinomonadaceae bacterium]|nr:hypothetical protein [Pyrinomonadaceae bacterium]
MSEVELTEQLDQAVEAVLRYEPPAPSVDPQIAELATIAAELRDLPREDFKAKLKEKLRMEAAGAAMASPENAVEPAPAKETPSPREDLLMVTPYVIVSDVHQEIKFIEQVFGAEGKIHGLGSKGGFHSEFRIGDSLLMIG